MSYLIFNEISVDKYLELDRRFGEKQRRLTQIADQRRDKSWEKEYEIAKKDHGLSEDEYDDLPRKHPIQQDVTKKVQKWANATLKGRSRIDKPGVIGHGAIVRLANWMDKKNLYQDGLNKH